MPQDYTPRRTSSASRRQPVHRVATTPGMRRQPPRRGGSRRRGTPPILPILLLVAVLAVIVVVIILVARSCSSSQPQEGPASSASQLSSLPAENPGSAVSGVTSEPAPTPSAEPTPAPQEAPEAPPETIGGLMVVDDTAYEYYNFSESLTNQYITAVTDGGTKLEGQATVYDMVIPTSISIMLPDSYIQDNNVNTSNQKQAIDEYIYPSIQAINPDVKTVSIYDTLKSHANEYLYFRTDHHWTQLGAYYGYVEFCKVRGFEPVALDQFEKVDYEGYLGSFYASTNSAAMAANPDTVEAYIPKADTTLTFTQTDGQTVEDWPLIADADEYGQSMKYIAYCAGDQPYEVITNNDMADGPSCVVVKESFGNCFLPFLVNHYKNVYVVDYRYYNGTVSDLVSTTGATDVLCLNNISMTRNEGLVNSFSNIF